MKIISIDQINYTIRRDISIFAYFYTSGLTDATMAGRLPETGNRDYNYPHIHMNREALLLQISWVNLLL